MRRNHLVIALVSVIAVATNACSSGKHTTPAKPQTTNGQQGWYVYWDENEEQDFVHEPAGTKGQLIPPWDPNGQMCVTPGGSGRFAVGYNPTLPSQDNPGSAKPYKEPPVGEALYDAHGAFSGQTMYVPGLYKLENQRIGGDIPPDAGKGTYNGNGTYTGCAFDHEGNLFATDLGTAQGDYPSPDDGRLIEWFAPSFTDACIVYGPTDGGNGTHHVDGHGGLRQPGDLAVDAHDDVYVPEAGTNDNGVPAGRVVRFEHASFPTGPADCRDNLYPRDRIRSSIFVQGSLAFLPFPLAIARDPKCNCWAVDTVFGNPAVAWFDDQGKRINTHPVIPGEALDQLGDPKGYNPFGIAFGPDGTLYMVDIHIHCRSPLVGCGPTSQGGRVLQFTFTNGQPTAPVEIATGLDFPTSVTVCVPDTTHVCPEPK